MRNKALGGYPPVMENAAAADLDAAASSGLVRGLGLKEATATNVVQMVGIGPFITIPFLVSAMGGPQAMLGWLVGAILAVCDGLVWAELGAAMPGAGGSYVYLREAYGPKTMGRMMSFLFVWMILFTVPLGAASGGVGFAEYMHYLIPTMGPLTTKVVAVAVILFVTFLAYRDIQSVGRLSFWLMVVVVGSIAWVIVSGLFRMEFAHLFDFPENAFLLRPQFFTGLGAASLIAIYGYGGYNNVCYLGGEVQNPTRTIPRAVILSILVVVLLYLLMTASILGVVPWQEVVKSQHVVSDFMEMIYGPWGARGLTLLILGASLASVFAILLGSSRIPYAAAADGEFFPVFAKLHPTGRFPHFSLLFLGIGSTVFCFFKLEEIIQILIVIQIIILFLAQVLAVTLIRRRKEIERPFQMWFYPLPSLTAAAVWLLVLVSTGWRMVGLGVAVLAMGIGAYMLRACVRREWPFAASA